MPFFSPTQSGETIGKQETANLAVGIAHTGSFSLVDGTL